MHPKAGKKEKFGVLYTEPRDFFAPDLYCLVSFRVEDSDTGALESASRKVSTKLHLKTKFKKKFSY